MHKTQEINNAIEEMYECWYLGAKLKDLRVGSDFVERALDIHQWLYKVIGDEVFELNVGDYV